MSRFRQFLERFNQVVLPLTQTYSIDMGSVSTRIIVDGRVVFSEPTLLVVHKKTGSIVAFGNKAALLRGKLPSALEMVEPVVRGRLQNIRYSALFLETVLDEGLHFRGQKSTVRQKVNLILPCDVTPAYAQAMEKIAAKAGFILGSSKNQPKAAYDWFVKQNILSEQACVLVIGGDISEISFISQGETVACQRILFGGNDLTKAIKQALKQAYQIEVGFETAELVKKELADLTKRKQEPVAKHMVIKGKDILKNVPTTTKISTEDDDWDVTALCAEQLQNLVEGMRDFFQQLPPDLLTHTLDKGIFVTGGSSQIRGLSSFLEKKFQTAINLSKTPELDVVHGLYANSI